MEKLPIEILEQIFKYFHQKDKVQCMLVCRSWKYAIKNTVLFNTIHIRSKQRLDKLVNTIRLDPQNGYRVERLNIEAKDLRRSDICILPTLFPNICEIKFHLNFLEEYTQLTEEQDFCLWKTKIKVIDNSFDSFSTYQILKGDICPLLTEIRTMSVIKNDAERLIKLLGNAPNLKILELTGFNLTLMNLEALHNNVPSLEFLSITINKINALILPTDIKSASYLEKLHLGFVSIGNHENFINFEKYLAKKYPRITHLNFGVSMGNVRKFETCMNRGFALQIQQIGPHLTSLEYSSHDDCFQFLFPILDRSDCRIKEIILSKDLNDSDFEQIFQSNQARYIQTFSCRISAGLINTKKFHKLTTLKELKLHIVSSTVFVDWNNIMAEVGDNLEIFELHSARISPDISAIPSCFKLKKLTLKDCLLMPDTDYFISHAFPNLRNLFIDECLWNSTEFCMTNLSLTHLEIRLKLPTENTLIMTITTHNNEKRWYLANKISKLNLTPTSDSNMYRVARSFPFDTFQYKKPYKSFICKSIYTFSLINYRSPFE